MIKAEALAAETVIPVVCAPMFIVSGVGIVTASCKAGIIGAFPALNGRTSEDFEEMLIEIDRDLDEYRAENPDAIVSPYGVNLNLRKNPRIEADLEICCKYEVPLIITSLGKPDAIVKAVHGYGGTVVSDVVFVEHAKKVADAGVDGLVLVCAGAGGHGGRLNPFAFVPAVREFFDGMLLVAGGISTGGAIRAIKALGADFAYMGTRFIASEESLAEPEYIEMMKESVISDVVYTPNVTGVHANFMKQSLLQSGFDLTDPLNVIAPPKPDNTGRKAWKSVWSAGQGVHVIRDAPSVQSVVDRLSEEYENAQETGRV